MLITNISRFECQYQIEHSFFTYLTLFAIEKKCLYNVIMVYNDEVNL